MSRESSLADILRGLIAMAGLALLVACGGGSSSTTPPVATPTIALTPGSLTFSGQFVGSTSAAQSITVTNSGSAALNFSGISITGDFVEINTCGTGIPASSVCTVNVTFKPTATGSRTGTLTLTDNASGSPHTVSLAGSGTSVSISPTALTFTGIAVGDTSAAQPVKLTNTNTAALSISSIAITSGSADFAQTNTCGASVPAAGNCQINVTFTPPATGTLTGTLTVTDNADGTAGNTQVVSLSGTASGSNTVPVSVNFGPNGFTTTGGAYYNGIFTTVTVCEPGTSTCTDVPNVLVDTGSTGLRVLSSAITNLTLPQINDGQGDTLNECLEFASLDYTWGPVSMATVRIGGEVASQVPAAAGGAANGGVPIQVVTANGGPPSGASCTLGGGGSLNSVASLGANGILGVGNGTLDCGSYCEQSNPTSFNSPPWPYIVCNSSSCGYATSVGPTDQVWNPVAAFSSSDTNGIALQLPSVSAGGAPSVQGSLTFGIGTDPDNAIPNGAQIYEQDSFGNFASLTYNGVSYTTADSGGSFLDSGSNALFILDPATITSATSVNTTNCADNAYYCVASPLSLSITLFGSNGTTSPAETLNIANADTLLNSSNAAVSNLAGSSGGNSEVTDTFDLGLPFFYGRTVFVNIAGTDTTYPNGYWAF